MIKRQLFRELLVVVTTVIFIWGGQLEAQAGGSVQNSSRALEYSLKAVAYSSVASMQLVFGAAAIPLGVAAELGKVSGEMSDAMWEVANTPVDEPFPVADEAIMIGPPPARALENEGDKP